MDSTSLLAIGITLLVTAGVIKAGLIARNRPKKEDSVAEVRARIKVRAEERAYAPTAPDNLGFPNSVEVTDVYELTEDQRAIISTVMTDNGQPEVKCRPAALRRGDASWSDTAFSDNLDPWGKAH